MKVDGDPSTLGHAKNSYFVIFIAHLYLGFHTLRPPNSKDLHFQNIPN